jgi:hypothetical protein
MTIDKVYELILFLTVSEKKGKHTPEEICNALHLGQTDYYNSLRPKQAEQQGEVLAQSTYIHEALNPFRVVKPFTNGDTPNGLLTLSDSEHILAVMTQTSSEGVALYSPVPIVNDDELANRLDSQIVNPTERRPVVNYNSAKVVQFYPMTPKAGKVFYLKSPTPPVYGYRESGRDLIYSAARSTDLEWNDSYIPQVIMRALQYLGANLDAETVYQAAQQKQAEVR